MFVRVHSVEYYGCDVLHKVRMEKFIRFFEPHQTLSMFFSLSHSLTETAMS